MSVFERTYPTLHKTSKKRSLYMISNKEWKPHSIVPGWQVATISQGSTGGKVQVAAPQVLEPIDGVVYRYIMSRINAMNNKFIGEVTKDMKGNIDLSTRVFTEVTVDEVLEHMLISKSNKVAVRRIKRAIANVAYLELHYITGKGKRSIIKMFDRIDLTEDTRYRQLRRVRMYISQGFLEAIAKDGMETLRYLPADFTKGLSYTLQEFEQYIYMKGRHFKDNMQPAKEIDIEDILRWTGWSKVFLMERIKKFNKISTINYIKRGSRFLRKDKEDA